MNKLLINDANIKQKQSDIDRNKKKMRNEHKYNVVIDHLVKQL